MEILKFGKSQLSYWDKGTGQAIVFIHGVATLGELWAEDLADLATNFRIIVYDRRGYGASSSSPRNWRALLLLSFGFTQNQLTVLQITQL
jgi:pimeloyl-ACP methyl ester carboxylesterase